MLRSYALPFFTIAPKILIPSPNLNFTSTCGLRYAMRQLLNAIKKGGRTSHAPQSPAYDVMFVIGNTTMLMSYWKYFIEFNQSWGSKNFMNIIHAQDITVRMNE